MRRRWWEIRAAKTEADLFEIQTEEVGGNLRHRRISTRPHVARRDFDFSNAVWQKQHKYARRIDLLGRIAKKKNATPTQIAIGWLLGQQPWIVPIPGTTKLHRLEENLGAMNVELTGHDLAEIERAASAITVEGRALPRSAGSNDRPLRQSASGSEACAGRPDNAFAEG
jgi:aryl-alcohol dehydrogenase-like predicted oxidoreductase